MKTITRYITNDGQEFVDQTAAIAHEKVLEGKKVYFFELNGELEKFDLPTISGATVRTFLNPEQRGYNIYVMETPVDKKVNDSDSFHLPAKFYAFPNGVWGG